MIIDQSKISTMFGGWRTTVRERGASWLLVQRRVWRPGPHATRAVRRSGDSATTPARRRCPALHPSPPLVGGVRGFRGPWHAATLAPTLRRTVGKTTFLEKLNLGTVAAAADPTRGAAPRRSCACGAPNPKISRQTCVNLKAPLATSPVLTLELLSLDSLLALQ